MTTTYQGLVGLYFRQFVITQLFTPPPSHPVTVSQTLLHRHALSQISRLVDVQTALHGYLVGEEL